MRFARIVSLPLLMVTAASYLHASESEDTPWSILTEYVYMKRSKVTHTRFARDLGNQGNTILSSGNLVNQMGFESGARIGLTYTTDPKSSYQSRFMYIAPWTGSKERNGPGTFYYPFEVTRANGDYFNADRVEATYSSQFYTLDLNYWRNSRGPGSAYFVVSGVFGLRFFHLQDKSTLAFTGSYSGALSKSNYDTKARNDVIGFQGGFNFQMNPFLGFRFDLLALGGIGLNRAFGTDYMLDKNNSFVLKDHQMVNYQTVVFADAEAKLGYQIVKYFNMHIGYQLFYASGLAFSPAQYNYKNDFSYNNLYSHGHTYIQGLFVGMNFDF
ncbi:MAG: hypothetical protein EBZ47_00370 [Chlamydiae bacterium]|nr:hypothetical protein [Chlamydiota bacterium]